MEYSNDCQNPPHDPVNLNQDEHRLLANVRSGIAFYCLQSPAHFALNISARPYRKIQQHDNGNTRVPKLKVCFQVYGGSIHKACRPFILHGRPTRKDRVQVREGLHWIELETGLEVHFPVSDDVYVSENTMRDYWDSNGQIFPWIRLPTELKEQVLQFCLCQTHGYSRLDYNIQEHRNRYGGLKKGAYEIIDQLGEWSALLHVSRQIRALVIRLTIVHNDWCPGGLYIASKTLFDFKKSFKRLGSYFQIKEDDSIPTDARTEELAMTYWDFPKQYPHLSQFAVMRHGIRRVSIQFNWLDAFYFFKLSAGSLDQWRPKYYMTCDIFEKLPNLDKIHVGLPCEWLRNEGTIRRGPKLFCGQDSCPRVLQRMIYEQIATELAGYRGLSVTRFVDEDEAQAFWDLREAAIQSLKFTTTELNDLYAECDGGIQLDSDSSMDRQAPGASQWTNGQSTPWTLGWNRSTPRHKRSFKEFVLLPDDADDIFPPQCFCDVSCYETYFTQG